MAAGGYGVMIADRPIGFRPAAAAAPPHVALRPLCRPGRSLRLRRALSRSWKRRKHSQIKIHSQFYSTDFIVLERNLLILLCLIVQ